jgi:hypothetical protein
MIAAGVAWFVLVRHGDAAWSSPVSSSSCSRATSVDGTNLAALALRSLSASSSAIRSRSRGVGPDAPTSIFDDLGRPLPADAHGYDCSVAVLRSATVPVGWMIGAPAAPSSPTAWGSANFVTLARRLVAHACMAWISTARQTCSRRTSGWWRARPGAGS